MKIGGTLKANRYPGLSKDCANLSDKPYDELELCYDLQG